MELEEGVNMIKYIVQNSQRTVHIHIYIIKIIANSSIVSVDVKYQLIFKTEIEIKNIQY